MSMGLKKKKALKDMLPSVKLPDVNEAIKKKTPQTCCLQSNCVMSMGLKKTTGMLPSVKLCDVNGAKNKKAKTKATHCLQQNCVMSMGLKKTHLETHCLQYNCVMSTDEM